MDNNGTKILSPKIADLPFNERPMEKLQAKGPAALSDADLLAILLRSGRKGSNALEMSYRILSGQGQIGKSALGALSGRAFLRQADAEELAEFEGIGSVKAHQIVAALELGEAGAQ